MSRHANLSANLASPRNLRLGALVLVFIAINQVDDPLVDPTLGQELVYWFVRIAVLAGGLLAADRLVASYLADRWASPAWFKPVVVVTAIALVPFAVAEILIEPHLPIRPEYSDDELWAFSPLLALLSEYATIVSLIVPVHLVLWLIIERKPAVTAAGTDDAVPRPRPEFLTRAAIGGVEDVLALKAEEHYVRIYTADGAELVHYRFGDAVKEMPPELGLRVHRSWWVAEGAIRSAKRGDRRWQLNLTADVAVPVSDSYVASVRERGWLKRKVPK